MVPHTMSGDGSAWQLWIHAGNVVSRMLSNMNDAVNRIKIHLKIWSQDIPVFRLANEHTIESAAVCIVASRVTKGMFTKLVIQFVANVAQLYVQTLVLQTIPISWLIACD